MVKKRSFKKIKYKEKRTKELLKKQKYYNSKKKKICNTHKTRKDCHHWTTIKQYKAKCVWLRDILTPWKSSCRWWYNGAREQRSFNDYGDPRF